MAVPIADALHDDAISLDVEAAAAPDRNTPAVAPGVLSCRYSGCHYVPGLETEYPAETFGARAWKAVLVHPAHLTAAMPHGLDGQGRQDRRHVETAYFTHAGRIDPVGLGQVETGAVEFGPASRPAMNG